MSDEILQELKALKQHVDSRFDHVDSRFDQLEAKLDADVVDIRRGMSEGFTAIQDQIDALKGQPGGNGPRRVASSS